MPCCPSRRFVTQIEADVEPFRGILLGLFFLAVGMSLDLEVVVSEWRLILLAVPALMLVKGACTYTVARLVHSPHRDALDRAVLMAQGGEFAFVLFGTAEASEVIAPRVNDALTAVVVLSMALTPLVVLATKRFTKVDTSLSMDGIPIAHGLSGSVLLIGFGRFGQVTSQLLLARGVDVTIIDTDIEMIQSAGTFGFKVYYGDGTRLDVLQASGAGSARAIAVCTDVRGITDRIVELCKHEFPQAKLLARSYDREHSLKLINAGVDYQVRETFESALIFGTAALTELGIAEDDAREVAAEIRQRDGERFALEMAAQDSSAGLGLLFGNDPEHAPKPTPFTTPQRESRVLNPEAAEEADIVPA